VIEHFRQFEGAIKQGRNQLIFAGVKRWL